MLKSLFTSILSLLFISSVLAQVDERKILQELCGSHEGKNFEYSLGPWKKTGDKYCIRVECKNKIDESNFSNIVREKCILADEYLKGMSQPGSQSGQPQPGMFGDVEIPEGHACYEKCKNKSLAGKTGLDRKACVECLQKHYFSNPSGGPNDLEEVVCEDNAGNAYSIQCDDGKYVNQQGLVDYMVKESIKGNDEGKIPKVTYKGAKWHCVRLKANQVGCTSEAKKQKDGTYIYDLYQKQADVNELEGTTKANLRDKQDAESHEKKKVAPK